MRILAVLVMLVLVLLMLDILGKSGDILAVEGNGQAQLLTYASLRIPQLIQSFLPYSVLLATLIGLVALNQNSEVIAMKAAGMSAHQVLAPLLLTALMVSAVSFAFNERIVTRATATLKAWEAAEYGPLPDSSDRTRQCLSDRRHTRSERQGHFGNGRCDDDAGRDLVRTVGHRLIAQQLRADRATYAAPGWRVENATRFIASTAQTHNVAQADRRDKDLSPEEIELSRVDPATLSFFELSDAIDSYEAAGRRTSELRTKWWHKISGPLSAFLMPLLGSIAAFGLARSGQVFLRALIGMALGFTYFVVDNAALAMGDFGGYSPLLAAWAPFVLFFLIGETVLIRTEE